ncbi:MAG TPA: dihydrofolate reductase family protein [Bacteroidales bacterium]|jgi:2,5-diamino-6-(ribosylamino)-4(3H)-pyrimidinone 5'-phosphate reductase|nr:dihydrofolate reductase family protein [Bacteroidales bacterium]NLD64852.1 RibD family protein [Bacteroidales bacterium]HOO66649.1 dihydrofolate reductase family protein [Bacteroidales bacterium]HPJ05420.1 dihydrofolate reductase family protein [Bacteroidales bacterium]HPQ64303.1 dihydrofolate reductase family protein [Bacteroidales bacterium]
MKPYIILHNSVSLDGSLTGFMPDMELHYRLAGSFEPDANLIGSSTVIQGQEMFGNRIPDEVPDDFVPPKRDSNLPWWIIVDSKGKLKGMLHTCRRFEYCRDVILLVTDQTPEDYIEHLEERKYRYIRTRGEKVDLQEALQLLAEEYGVKRIVTDTGRILANLLLDAQLVDEISVLVHPLIRGRDSYSMFSDVSSEVNLTLIREEKLGNGCVWIVYKPEYSNPHQA